MAIVKKFNSVDEFIDYGTAPGRHLIASGPFAGGTPHQWARYVRKGASEDEQEKVTELIEGMQASVTRTRREYVPSVAGSFPVVPDYLMGLPLNMRRRAPVDSELAPVRIFVDVSTAARISVKQLEVRGAAVCALIMRMVETRPVEVYAVGANTANRKTVGVQVRLDVHPISLSHMVAVFMSSQFIRGIRLSAQARAADAYGPSEGFPWAFSNNNGRVREEGMRRMFDMEPEDIYIAGASPHWINDITHDPTEWINRQVAAQAEVY